ncbi:MAG: hypothetical protein FJY51_03195 [Betaproteobacteria bacterium]|nr:hypothetical protein [Betaproteobacteria bacterium]
MIGRFAPPAALAATAGAQIREANNRTALPTLPPPDTRVKSLPQATGNLQRIWILSRQEIARPDPGK